MACQTAKFALWQAHEKRGILLTLISIIMSLKNIIYNPFSKLYSSNASKH